MNTESWRYTMLLYPVMDQFAISDVAFRVADFINRQSGHAYSEDGWCSKSAVKIGEAIRCSERTAQRAIKEGIDKGIIVVNSSMPQLRRASKAFILACDYAEKGGQRKASPPTSNPAPASGDVPYAKMTYPTQNGTKPADQESDTVSGVGYDKMTYPTPQEGVRQNDVEYDETTHAGTTERRSDLRQNDGYTYINNTTNSLLSENQKKIEQRVLDFQRQQNQRYSAYTRYPNSEFPIDRQNFILIDYDVHNKFLVPQSQFMVFVNQFHPAKLEGYERNWTNWDKVIADLFKKYHGTEFGGFEHVDRTILTLLRQVGEKAASAPLSSVAVRAKNNDVQTLTDQQRAESANRFSLRAERK